MSFTSSDLTLVEEAIRALIGGAQRFSVFNRVYERADLSELRKLRAEIAKEIKQTARGGIRVRRGVPLG